MQALELISGTLFITMHALVAVIATIVFAVANKRVSDTLTVAAAKLVHTTRFGVLEIFAALFVLLFTTVRIAVASPANRNAATRLPGRAVKFVSFAACVA